jgi:hypothetical protein
LNQLLRCGRVGELVSAIVPFASNFSLAGLFDAALSATLHLAGTVLAVLFDNVI